ncbi:MAG: NERD domain-containing protein [Coriobacteriia bacterium]|nr:NERD domain-containing protein [Coriobacteriia bacterium]
MSYAESKVFGDRGEAIVAEVVQRHCPPDAVILNDLLFDGVDTTTQVDHILIDRFGLLLIETKYYNALLKGTSDDRTWTACYQDGGRRQLHNPLRQNEGHRTKLLRTLQQNGYRLDPSYTQSVIVFARGHVGDLDLTVEDRARVLTADEFDHHLATRADFAPNSGDLNPDQIAAIGDLVSTLDRSADAKVQARHERMVKKASGRKFGRGPRPARTSTPRPRTPRSTSRPRRQANPLGALLAVLLFAAWIWGPRALDFFSGPEAAPAPATAPQAQLDFPAPSVGAALERVREADPIVADSLVDAESPALSDVKGYPTYTWQYARQTGPETVSVRKLSVSFDQSGQIVGVSKE